MKIRSLLVCLGSAWSLWSQTVDGPGCAVNPASPSVGADVPITYFAPLPSASDPKLLGPLQLLTAGTLDANAGTLRLPLYQGRMRDGRAVWYVLTIPPMKEMPGPSVSISRPSSILPAPDAASGPPRLRRAAS